MGSTAKKAATGDVKTAIGTRLTKAAKIAQDKLNKKLGVSERPEPADTAGVNDVILGGKDQINPLNPTGSLRKSLNRPKRKV